MREVFTFGSNTVTLTTGGTTYYCARIDGLSGREVIVRTIEAWIDNPVSTDSPWELVLLTCATANVDTEWAAITGQKWDSASQASVATPVYRASGGTPNPTSTTELLRYGGISYASRFSKPFVWKINPSQSGLVAAIHPTNAKTFRASFEIDSN